MCRNPCSNRIKKFLIILLLLGAVPLFSDVLVLSDGRILVGSIIGPMENGVGYTIAGRQVVIQLKDLVRTEQSVSEVGDITVIVVLKDGSRIQGKIVDYDEEIGTFLDMGFGVLTVPVTAIEEMYDPLLRSRYAGSPLQIRLGGGAYLPVVQTDEDFGPSWTMEGGFAYALPFYRGLYAGLSLSVSGADFKPDPAVDYYFISFLPSVELRYFEWRARKDLFSRVTPFAAAEAGMTYISMTDPSLYPETQGSLAGNLGVSAGFDFSMTPQFTARVKLSATMILQASSPFVTTGAGIFFCYEP